MSQLQSTPPAPPLPNEPPGPGGTPPTPDPPPPQPDVHPSGTPDGPSIIPAPHTPPGEPGPDPDPDQTGSDPNAGGPVGLAGAMGVSSERVPDNPDSIEGTGSRGTATSRANGTWATLIAGGGGNGDDSEPEGDDRPHPQDPAEGPEMDDRQQQATQEWRENEPAVNVDPEPNGG